uniref:Uncharacterized protein n=1 Tax=Anopheles atroparvus TaxID=41427 RepID=A0A182IXE3_ANOAO
MYAQLQSGKASWMYSYHRYDVGKYSSFAWLGLLATETVKHINIELVFRLKTSVETHNFAPPAGRRTWWCPITIRRAQWKEWFGFAKLFILSLVFYGFVCFVLGAPLEKWEETISLAFALTTLTIFPIMRFIGQSRTYQLLLSEKLELKNPLANNYLNLLKNNCIAVNLGAWGGSVVAPLDWDRPWQE